MRLISLDLPPTSGTLHSFCLQVLFFPWPLRPHHPHPLSKMHTWSGQLKPDKALDSVRGYGVWPLPTWAGPLSPPPPLALLFPSPETLFPPHPWGPGVRKHWKPSSDSCSWPQAHFLGAPDPPESLSHRTEVVTLPSPPGGCGLAAPAGLPDTRHGTHGNSLFVGKSAQWVLCIFTGHVWHPSQLRPRAPAQRPPCAEQALSKY